MCVHTETSIWMFISSIIHNSPKAETTKCSSSDEWIFVYPYNGVLLAIKIHATRWVNVENIMLKWKKPETKGHRLYDFMYMKYTGKASIQR